MISDLKNPGVHSRVFKVFKIEAVTLDKSLFITLIRDSNKYLKQKIIEDILKEKNTPQILVTNGKELVVFYRGGIFLGTDYLDVAR